MTRYIAPRGSGKTSWAIEYALKNNAILVTHFPDVVYARCAELGLPQPKTIDYRTYFKDPIRTANKKVVIDDLNALMHSYFGGTVIAYTDTEGEA